MAHPAVRKLSFTGSTEVGRGLLKASADRVISTSMELDGNAPLIVLMSAVTTSRDVLRPALWSAGFSLGRIVVGAEDDDLIATIAAEDAYEERLDPAAVRGGALVVIGGLDPYSTRALSESTAEGLGDRLLELGGRGHVGPATPRDTGRTVRACLATADAG
jgi:hypothetical protein